MRKVFFMLLVLVVAGFLMARCNRPVSDAILIERWQKNRAAFDELLAITIEDSKLRNRTAQTKAELALKLKGMLGIESASGNDGVGYEFCAFSSGSALSGREKGFYYGERKPDPVKESLDSLFGRDAGLQYRHIEGNWYLFLFIDE